MCVAATGAAGLLKASTNALYMGANAALRDQSRPSKATQSVRPTSPTIESKSLSAIARNCSSPMATCQCSRAIPAPTAYANSTAAVTSTPLKVLPPQSAKADSPNRMPRRPSTADQRQSDCVAPGESTNAVVV